MSKSLIHGDIAAVGVEVRVPGSPDAVISIPYFHPHSTEVTLRLLPTQPNAEVLVVQDGNGRVLLEQHYAVPGEPFDPLAVGILR